MESDRPESSDSSVTRNTSGPAGRAPSRRTGVSAFWRAVRLTVTATMCIAAAAAGTIIGNIYFHSKTGRDFINTAFISAIRHRGDPLADFDYKKQLPVEKQTSINLLMLGCDVDYENDRPVVLKNARGRSDSIMIAKMDFTRNSISVLSIPRDTAVHIPGHGITKINAANALEGPDLTAETIKQAFGIDTDYYVAINFITFKKIVDKLGGVDLTVTEKKGLNYDDDWGDLHVHLKPGFQHLNGYQAMGYVRIRHSDDDLHRAMRQHAFLEAIRAKAKSPETLLKAADFLNLVDSDVHRSGDLSMTQIITLANWCRTVPKENVTMETLPSFEGHSYVTVNIPKAEETIKRVFFDNLTPVTINVPGAEIVDNLGSSHSHKSHRKGGSNKASKSTPAADSNVNNGDAPDTIIPSEHPAAPAPTTGGSPAGSDDASKGGAKSGDSGKSNDDNKSDGKSGV